MGPTVVSSLAVPVSFTAPYTRLGSPHQLHDGPQCLKQNQLLTTADDLQLSKMLSNV